MPLKRSGMGIHQENGTYSARERICNNPASSRYSGSKGQGLSHMGPIKVDSSSSTRRVSAGIASSFLGIPFRILVSTSRCTAAQLWSPAATGESPLADSWLAALMRSAVFILQDTTRIRLSEPGAGLLQYCCTVSGESLALESTKSS